MWMSVWILRRMSRCRPSWWWLTMVLALTLLGRVLRAVLLGAMSIVSRGHQRGRGRHTTPVGWRPIRRMESMTRMVRVRGHGHTHGGCLTPTIIDLHLAGRRLALSMVTICLGLCLLMTTRCRATAWRIPGGRDSMLCH